VKFEDVKSMSKDSLDPRIIELLKRKLNGIVSPHTIPSAISRTKERYPFLTPNAAAEVYGSRYHVSAHKFLNEKDREALGTFAVGKTNIRSEPRVELSKRAKISYRPKENRKHLEEEISMQKEDKNWDVFICYKRISAKDFAEATKKILEEYGIQAFLDIKDIPSKFKGTEQWSDARDNAVRKCKVFVLIMTAGFDLSSEVKKELTMARSVPGKDFTNFRHKNLSPNQKIILEKEVVDFSKQQQHSFDTCEDLVRTVHKVLVGERSPSTNNQKQNSQSTSQMMAPVAAPTQSIDSGISISAAIGNFAAFYDQVYGARKIQKVYPSLFSLDEMTSPGKAAKICRVLESFKNDKRQLKQALQTIINLHRDYSQKNITSLRDIIDVFGFSINDDLSITNEKKTYTGEDGIKELVKQYHEAVFDDESSAPLPYKRCPECGSANLEGSSCSIQDDNVFTLKCKNCGWSDGQVL
jgi:hypothetical protein